jgi:hypothetical protein
MADVDHSFLQIGKIMYQSRLILLDNELFWVFKSESWGSTAGTAVHGAHTHALIFLD